MSGAVPLETVPVTGNVPPTNAALAGEVMATVGPCSTTEVALSMAASDDARDGATGTGRGAERSTSRVTVAPAAMKTSSAIVVPSMTVDPAPTQTRSPATTLPHSVACGAT